MSALELVIYIAALSFGFAVYKLCKAVVAVLRRWEAATRTIAVMPTEAELRNRDEAQARKAFMRYTKGGKQ